jgi:outer membrane protein insertion porin family
VVLKKAKKLHPGEEISSHQKLGKLSFDEISFYINRIQNDSIYLDLEIRNYLN